MKNFADGIQKSYFCSLLVDQALLVCSAYR